MRLLKEYWSIRYRMPGSDVMFIADMPKVVYRTPSDAVTSFNDLWPTDVVMAVQDDTGRFAWGRMVQ